VTDSDRLGESSGLRRTTRVSKPVDRYQGHQKQVTFAEDPMIQKKFEEAYNIVFKLGTKKMVEYGLNAVQLAAKFMMDMHDQVTIADASSLKKGLQ
jgi:hypothetical protein